MERRQASGYGSEGCGFDPPSADTSEPPGRRWTPSSAPAQVSNAWPYVLPLLCPTIHAPPPSDGRILAVVCPVRRLAVGSRPGSWRRGSRLSDVPQNVASRTVHSATYETSAGSLVAHPAGHPGADDSRPVSPGL